MRVTHEVRGPINTSHTIKVRAILTGHDFCIYTAVMVLQFAGSKLVCFTASQNLS